MSFDRATDYIKELSFADPEIAKSVEEKLEQNRIRLTERQAGLLFEEVAWALSLEYSFGKTLAEGYISLYAAGEPDRTGEYRELVREAGEEGPTLGRILAEHLVPVLEDGDEELLVSFMDAVGSMRRKGTYALSDPLRAVSVLLGKGDKKTCSALLKILKDLFAEELTYSECRHFSHIIPKEIFSFTPSKRVWQTEALYRIMQENYRLIDPFFDGMAKGLSFLTQEALNEFISLGFRKYAKDKLLGTKFISLESRSAAETLAKLQTTAPLSHVRLQLYRYMKAKTGRLMSISPFSRMPGIVRSQLLSENGDRPFVFSDGKYLYLPDEISFFETYEENRSLYKSLARLESGLYEFNTFGFDLEKAVSLIGSLSGSPDFSKKYLDQSESGLSDCSDMERFFSFFPVPEIACDLFNIFEFGRIRIISAEKYPGLIRLSYPEVISEAERIYNAENQGMHLFQLYMLIALGKSIRNLSVRDCVTAEFMKSVCGAFEEAMKTERVVETSAFLVFKTYDTIFDFLKERWSGLESGNSYRPFKMPFGRRLRPDLHYAANKKYDDAGRQLKSEFQKKNIPVFKSDIISRLEKNGGTLSEADLNGIIISFRDFADSHGIKNSDTPPGVSLSAFSELNRRNDETYYPEENGSPLFWYREWDANLCD
ncbi:MAG: hypothetical protein EHM30_12035, partial [Desulfobacteraceae bacterium]